ncbi:hypothetical protein FQN54_002870 [Arachnomyces sp. PD_36]|nr:hypothetical protein FQN54_002870 [Arachnomyces sp. PD_36]
MAVSKGGSPEGGGCDFSLARKEFAKLSRGDQDGPIAAPKWLLNPTFFSRMKVDGDLTPGTAVDVLLTIIKRICLKRTMNDRVQCVDEEGNDKTIRIGDSIPEYKICTIELVFDEKLQAAHDAYFFYWLDQLHRSGGEKGIVESAARDSHDKQKRINFRANRRLSHLAFNPRLEDLALATDKLNLATHIAE